MTLQFIVQTIKFCQIIRIEPKALRREHQVYHKGKLEDKFILNVKIN